MGPAGGKSPGPEPGGPAGDGWTLLDDGWYGKGPLPDGRWRIVRRPEAHEGQRWGQWLVEVWPLLTADALQLYGVDLADGALLRARPWSWLLALIDGLLTARSRVSWEAIGPERQRAVREALAKGADVTPWL